MKELSKQIDKIIFTHCKLTSITRSMVLNKIMDLVEDKIKSPVKIFIPPTSNEVKNYIIYNELLWNSSISHLDEISVLFVKYYESVGWVVGKHKTPMQNWKSSVSAWCKRKWNQEVKAKMDESIKAHLLIQQQING